MKSFKYRYIIILLIFIFCSPVMVNASDSLFVVKTGEAYKADSEEAEDIEDNTEEDKPFDPNEDLNCKSAAVIDVKTGKFLYEYNSDKRAYPGGLLKLMTGLVILENVPNADNVLISNNSYYTESPDSDDVILHPGESISVKNLLYILMLKSGEEAAYALSEYRSKSSGEFSKEMNEVAEKIGCTSSQFKGPNNQFGDGTISSAHDMALIAAELYKHPLFKMIIETDIYKVPATNKSEEREIWQENKMKYSANKDYYHENHIGGKVGYSELGGGCFVSYAERDGMTIACVVMGCDPQELIYSDTSGLYDYVFERYDRIYPLRGYKIEVDEEASPILSNFNMNVDHTLPFYYVDDDICINVDKGTKDNSIKLVPVMFSQPQGNKAGTVDVYYKDKVVAQSDILIGISSVYSKKSSNSINEDTATSSEPAEDKYSVNKKNDKVKNIAVKAILVLALLIVTAFFVLIIVNSYAKRKRNHKK